MDNNIPSKIGWLSDEDCRYFVDNDAETLVKSVGYFFGKNKSFVTIIGDQDLGINQDKMRLLNIKKSCITKINQCVVKQIYGGIWPTITKHFQSKGASVDKTAIVT